MFCIMGLVAPLEELLDCEGCADEVLEPAPSDEVAAADEVVVADEFAAVDEVAAAEVLLIVTVKPTEDVVSVWWGHGAQIQKGAYLPPNMQWRIHSLRN